MLGDLWARLTARRVYTLYALNERIVIDQRRCGRYDVSIAVWRNSKWETHEFTRLNAASLDGAVKGILPEFPLKFS